MSIYSGVIRILLVDDHPVVRTGYKMLINTADDIEIIAEANSAGQAYKQYLENDCDVVVMDLKMPNISGLDAIRRIMTRDPKANILVFSMHEEIIYVEQAVKAGAKGFITKNCAPDVMVEAIRALSQGKPYFSADIAHHLVISKIRGDDTELSGLSTLEFEIFCLLAEGLDINDIARRLSLGYKTVSNYNSQIKSKLNCETVFDIVHLAIRNKIITP